MERRRVHILGGSPPKQLDAIRQLTRPTLTDNPQADIVGVDWNGLHRGAQFGEFWTADGCDDSGRDGNHVTVRKTVRHSLAGIREFWEAHGVWSETTPPDDGLDIKNEGSRPAYLEQATCTECGTNVWRTRRSPYVAEYDTGTICGYCSYECYFSPVTGTTSWRLPANRVSTCRRRERDDPLLSVKPGTRAQNPFIG